MYEVNVLKCIESRDVQITLSICVGPNIKVTDSTYRKLGRQKAADRKTQKHKKVIFAVEWRRNRNPSTLLLAPIVIPHVTTTTTLNAN